MSLNKLGRYDIVRVLGRGAMGLVYEALDPNLDRRVAIKTIKVENLSHEASIEYEARFRTEARSAARLQHPNIVSVYDSDRHGDVAYLVMEFIQGEDLKHHLDRGRLFTFEQSLRMADDLLAALEYAHRQNIVHRDVKPANLLLEADGRVKLTDFGVARIQDSGEGTRTRGSMVGTLKYMSPEQVRGQSVDARSDLFAAAVVLYQLLTGRRPFDGDSEFAISQQIIGATPLAPSAVNPRLPAAIDAVIARALAKQREQRYQSAHDFAQALRRVHAQALDPAAVPAPVVDRTRVATVTPRPGGAPDDTPSTITQEIELVYWKDVKDSHEAEDLALFLNKFPSGIYAELARRRLQRLTAARGAAFARPVFGTPPPGRPARAGETTQAQAREDATEAATYATARFDETLADDPDATRADTVAMTVVDPVPHGPAGDAWAAPAAAAQPAAAPVAAAQVTAGKGAAAPNTAGAGTRRRLPALAGAAALVVAALVALLWPGPGPDREAAAPADPPAAQEAAAIAPVVAAPTVTPVAPAPQPRPVASAPAAVLPGPVPASPKLAADSAPAKPAQPRAAPAKVLPPEAPVLPQASGAKPTVAKSASAEPAQSDSAGRTTAPTARSGPTQACEGRILLSYQICVNEQCARPEFSRHPVCIERRAAKQRAEAALSSERR